MEMEDYSHTHKNEMFTPLFYIILHINFLDKLSAKFIKLKALNITEMFEYYRECMPSRWNEVSTHLI